MYRERTHVSPRHADLSSASREAATSHAGACFPSYEQSIFLSPHRRQVGLSPEQRLLEDRQLLQDLYVRERRRPACVRRKSPAGPLLPDWRASWYAGELGQGKFSFAQFWQPPGRSSHLT